MPELFVSAKLTGVTTGNEHEARLRVLIAYERLDRLERLAAVVTDWSTR
jgi:hypothetical protein